MHLDVDRLEDSAIAHLHKVSCSVSVRSFMLGQPRQSRQGC